MATSGTNSIARPRASRTKALRRLRHHATTIALLLPGLGLILGFISVVLYFAIIQSFGQLGFQGDDRWTLESWRHLLEDESFFRSARYSMRVAVVSALAATALAYPFALWLKKPFAGSKLVSAFLKIPLLIPGLVAAFMFINFISFNGFFNLALQRLGIVDAPIRLLNDRRAIGVHILQIWKQMPFAFLLLSSAVREIDSDVLSAGRDVGAGAWQRFRHLVLPMTLPSLQAAMIIIFIGAAGDFSFQVVAGPSAPFSLAQLMDSSGNLGRDRNYAAVVGLMLMILSVVGSILLTAITKFVVNRRRFL